MEHRIQYDEPQRPATPRPNHLRAIAVERRERGRGSYRYTRATLASLLGLRPAAIYSAERRRELAVDDLASVARFIVRRLERQARRRQRADKRPVVSVAGGGE